MLKHFNADGLPIHKLNILQAPVKQSIDGAIDEQVLKGKQKWPEILLTQYHDLYYNKSESSEKRDAAMAKIQQMYVGSRETASTCHVLNMQQTVVHTKKPVVNKPDPVSRKTPRKIKPTKVGAKGDVVKVAAKVVP